jgi:hypothetical protein
VKVVVLVSIDVVELQPCFREGVELRLDLGGELAAH